MDYLDYRAIRFFSLSFYSSNDPAQTGCSRTDHLSFTLEKGIGKFKTSQASDVGSIPIARSINSDDSVDLTRLSPLNSTKKRRVLDGSWTVLKSIGGGYFAIELEPMVPRLENHQSASRQ